MKLIEKLLIVKLDANKVVQPLLMLGLLLIVIILSLLLIAFWPVYFLAGLFMKHKSFWKWQETFFETIPQLRTPKKSNEQGN